MNKFFIAFALVLAAFVSAETLTYTASSKVSQKDADQLALEGLSRQLRTKVSSDMAVRTSEDKNGKITQTFESFKNSSSNFVIKGARLKTLAKKDGMFQSTASVDTDQMASKILLDLSTLQSKIKAVDSIIRGDMLDGDYRKMASDMMNLEKMVIAYDENLEILSCIQKIPPELKLESTLDELSEFLKSSMSTIKIETKLNNENLAVSISDYAGPVAYFPLALTQDGKDLAHEKTGENGIATFTLEQLKKNKPSGDVVVHADLNVKYVRSSDVISKTVHYESARSRCSYNVRCNGPVEACAAFKKFLNDAGIVAVDDAKLPSLDVDLLFNDKVNSAKTLYTSRASISMKFGNVVVNESLQGVGRDASSAQVKAVQKLSASKIVDKYGMACLK